MPRPSRAWKMLFDPRPIQVPLLAEEERPVRRRAVISTLIATVLVLGVIPGAARAHTSSTDTRTRVTAHPGGKVRQGKEVELKGRVITRRPRCVNGVTVYLVKGSGRQVASDVMGRRGRFSFTVTPRRSIRYTVVYPGFVTNSVHPHNHVCEASSDSVRVRVKKDKD